MVEDKLRFYAAKLPTRGCPEYVKRIRKEGIAWNHKRIESIQVYWIEKAFLDIPKALSGVCLINFPNGGYFKRVYDNVQLPEDATINQIPVVISFQVHSYGNFAVIRNDETIVKQESKQ